MFTDGDDGAFEKEGGKKLGFLHKQVCKEFKDGQTELEQLPQCFQNERHSYY